MEVANQILFKYWTLSHPIFDKSQFVQQEGF